MIEASCHCGAIRLQINAPLTEVTDCNCSICRRYGVLWAYYSPRQVRFTAPGATDTYMWDDRSIAFHRCATCGCVTHWQAADTGRDKMGVNARLMATDVLSGAKVRHLDGALTEQYVD
ncbi:GFA family protein [Henriciella sp.]|uniref:GFA family protein n=1 Tax=Henriciella sp. TaxID=1968823 RepID=UPI0017A29D9B|nr:GFA family protein [Henriciella sp.]HIG23348.1 GFA family protein [Henriciella sp.]